MRTAPDRPQEESAQQLFPHLNPIAERRDDDLDRLALPQLLGSIENSLSRLAQFFGVTSVVKESDLVHTLRDVGHAIQLPDPLFVGDGQYIVGHERELESPSRSPVALDDGLTASLGFGGQTGVGFEARDDVFPPFGLFALGIQHGDDDDVVIRVRPRGDMPLSDSLTDGLGFGPDFQTDFVNRDATSVFGDHHGMIGRFDEQFGSILATE